MSIDDLVTFANTKLFNLQQQKEMATRLGDLASVIVIEQEIAETIQTLNVLIPLKVAI